MYNLEIYENESDINDIFTDVSSITNDNEQIFTDIDDIFVDIDSVVITNIRQNININQILNYFKIDMEYSDNNIKRKPCFIILLILTITIFFVVGMVVGNYPITFTLEAVTLLGIPNHIPIIYSGITRFPACKNIRNEVWRLISYQFVHSCFLHFFLNVFLIYIYGSLLEPYIIGKYSRTQLIIAYILSVIYGALGQSYVNGYQTLMGCSAGVYGLFGLIISVTMSKNIIPKIRCLLIINIIIQLIGEVIIFVFFYNSTFSYVSHFCGIITGYSVGNMFYTFSIMNKNKKADICFILFGLSLFIFETVFLLYYYIVQFPPKLAFNQNNNFNSCCYDLYNMNKSESLNMYNCCLLYTSDAADE